jgi:hypothetical protein
MKTERSTSTSGIQKSDPEPLAPQDGPYLQAALRAKETYPDPIHLHYTHEQARCFRRRVEAHGYILDMSYRQGILTVRYVGQRKGTR